MRFMKLEQIARRAHARVCDLPRARKEHQGLHLIESCTGYLTVAKREHETCVDKAELSTHQWKTCSKTI